MDELTKNEDQPPRCDCGYATSDWKTWHEEDCAYVKWGKERGLSLVAVAVEGMSVKEPT